LGYEVYAIATGPNFEIFGEIRTFITLVVCIVIDESKTTYCNFLPDVENDPVRKTATARRPSFERFVYKAP
jgi:hypothetical protein